MVPRTGSLCGSHFGLAIFGATVTKTITCMLKSHDRHELVKQHMNFQWKKCNSGEVFAIEFLPSLHFLWNCSLYEACASHPVLVRGE